MYAPDPCKLTSVSFFGGEPLLRFKVIREVVDWFFGVSWPSSVKGFIFRITTNGTLLNEEMKQWLAANRQHVILGLSMDGTKDAQDRNRSSSYDKVIQHIDFIRENWPTQRVKMTISPYTIDQTYAGIMNIHSFGLSVEPDVVFEDIWGDEESEKRAVRSWAEQLDRLVDYYFEHPDLYRPKLVTRELYRLFQGSGNPKRTFCGAGRYTNTYSADGTKFPCFRFASVCAPEPLHDVLATPDVENEKCAKCAFERICTSCEGLNYATTGSSFYRTSYHCRFFMVSLLASAKLLLLDHPEDLAAPIAGQSKGEKLTQMRRLLTIHAVNDVCAPVLEWCCFDSSSPPPLTIAGTSAALQEANPQLHRIATTSGAMQP
jgi:sulfatase maturation enzyme AslB (radical SAM superfamily)